MQVGSVACLCRGVVLSVVSLASRHGLPDHKDGRVVALNECGDGREGTGGWDGGLEVWGVDNSEFIERLAMILCKLHNESQTQQSKDVLADFLGADNKERRP